MRAMGDTPIAFINDRGAVDKSNLHKTTDIGR